MWNSRIENEILVDAIKAYWYNGIKIKKYIYLWLSACVIYVKEE